MYVGPFTHNGNYVRVCSARRGAQCRAAPAVQLLQHRQIPEKIGPPQRRKTDIPTCFTKLSPLKVKNFYFFLSTFESICQLKSTNWEFCVRGWPPKAFEICRFWIGLCVKSW